MPTRTNSRRPQPTRKPGFSPKGVDELADFFPPQPISPRLSTLFAIPSLHRTTTQSEQQTMDFKPTFDPTQDHQRGNSSTLPPIQESQPLSFQHSIPLFTPRNHENRTISPSLMSSPGPPKPSFQTKAPATRPTKLLTPAMLNDPPESFPTPKTCNRSLPILFSKLQTTPQQSSLQSPKPPLGTRTHQSPTTDDDPTGKNIQTISTSPSNTSPPHNEPVNERQDQQLPGCIFSVGTLLWQYFSTITKYLRSTIRPRNNSSSELLRGHSNLTPTP